MSPVPTAPVPTAPVRPLVPGYDLLGLLGAGGSGQVWRARRRADRLVVALKIIAVPASDCPWVLDEAAVLSRVRHRHLLHLHDVLPLPGADGRPEAVAMAVQLAGGGSLAQVLAARHHLTPGELVTVLGPVAGALADLHRLGVVHGDLSAGNVLFLADGMPMLSDLGVARLAGDPRPAGHGTDGMVAPELLEGLPATAESDVYAVGALAWLALAGEPPGWVGTREPCADVVPDAPARLHELIEGCLAPEPDDRPEIEQVATALFDAAVPEAVTLAPDADPAHGLTQRLRELAADDEEDAVARQARPVRSLHARARRRAAPAKHLAAGGPRGTDGRRWRLLAAVAAVGVVVGSAVAFRAPPTGAQAPAPTPPAVAAATPPAGPGPGGAPAPAGTPQSEPAGQTSAGPAPPAAVDPPSAALDDDPGATLQSLVDARAHAWASGDPADLRAAHVPGSAAMTADRADLEAAARAGVSYEGLRFTVTSARVTTSSPTQAVLKATIARSGYQVIEPQAPVAVPPDEQRVTVRLQQTAGGWRIAGWS